MTKNFTLWLFGMFLLASCTSTVPTPEQLDHFEIQARAEYQGQYDDLETRRRQGQISRPDYDSERASLDRAVRNKADTMAWNRHSLAQSELKSVGMPTPDRPVPINPPGMGTVQGSLYNSSRLNGIGNQAQNNFMQEIGRGGFNNPNRAGTIYD